MNYDVILVRYGELSLKSPYVRKSFESKLVANIRNALTHHNIACSINKDRGRIYVRTGRLSPSLNALSRVFGITSFSPAFETKATLDQIGAVAQKISEKKLSKDTSFALRVTRTGKHPFSSQDVAVNIGDVLICKTNATVDLTTPDIIIFIEIRNDKAYLFFEKISGVGGMPLGTQGAVLAVIDNLYSFLAAWYLMHRGCNLLIFSTTNLAPEQITSFFRYWFQEPHIITSSLTEKKQVREIRNVSIEKKCLAVATNHTLSKNPKRTVQELAALKLQLPVPILTPLISMERESIQQECKERGVPL